MEEIWKYSHTTTVGCTKSKEIKYFYSSEGRLKKVWYNGKIEISTPKKTGNKERIYVTIAKLFPEICGEWYEGCQVDHINTNRFDHRAINLRCCTAKENMCNELTRQHCSEAAKQRWEDGCYNLENFKGRKPWNKGLKYSTLYDRKPYLKKRVLSEETKRKIGAANKGKISPKKGTHISEETKRKIALAHLGRHWYVGEDGKRHY